MANILVTGGNGFIGSNLTGALLRQGHSVRILDNFSTGKEENLAFEENYPGLEIIMGDIVERKVCQSAMERVNTFSARQPFHRFSSPWKIPSLPTG